MITFGNDKPEFVRSFFSKGNDYRSPQNIYENHYQRKPGNLWWFQSAVMIRF